eukprot:6991300-Prymnesium_polylepis.1
MRSGVGVRAGAWGSGSASRAGFRGQGFRVPRFAKGASRRRATRVLSALRVGTKGGGAKPPAGHLARHGRGEEADEVIGVGEELNVGDGRREELAA